MLLECSVNIVAPGEMIPGRWCRAKVGLCNHRNATNLIVNTAKQNYKFPMENLKKIYSSALEFVDPPRTLMMKEGDPYKLKVLMKQCKAIKEGRLGCKLPEASDLNKYKPTATSINIIGNNYTLEALRNPSLQNVAFNGTNTLPKCVWNMRNLVCLTLHDCGLTDMPEKIIKICTNLKSLDLSGNKIRRLEPRILGIMGKEGKLVNLNLAKNCLKFLPLQIGFIKSLATLAVNDNQLHGLPFTFCALTQLKELNLANNCIKSLNQMSLDYLVLKKMKLVKLDVSGNPFKPFESKKYPFTLPDLFAQASAKVLTKIDLIQKIELYLTPDLEDYIHIRSELCCSCKKPFLRYNQGSPSKNFYFERIASTVTSGGGSANSIQTYAIYCSFCQHKLNVMESS